MVHDFSKAYTEAELEELKARFTKLESFKEGPAGGSISTKDIITMAGIIDYGKSQEELNVIIAYFEQKNNGILTMEEFLAVLHAFHDSAALLEMQARSFDVNGDGFICAEEFHLMLPPLIVHTPELKGISYETFLEEADANRDGKISIQECAAWVKKKVEQGKSHNN